MVDQLFGSNPLLFPTDKPILIRTSDRIFHRRCRRRWLFSSALQLNLEPKNFNPTLWFGRGLHFSLDQYHGQGKDPVKAFMRWINFSLNSYVERTGLPIWESDKAAQAETIQLGRGMLIHYLLWLDSPTREKLSIEPFRVVKTEQNLVVPLDLKGPQGQDVFYTLRLDGIVEDEFGDYYLLEHKGYKNFDEEKLVFDDQCSSYIWGANELFGISVKGILYNVLRKKLPTIYTETMKKGGLSIAQNQDTTYEAYRSSLDFLGIDRMPYQDFLYTLKKERGNNFFHRNIVPRSQFEIKNVGEQIKMQAYDMIYNANLIYPNYTRECD